MWMLDRMFLLVAQAGEPAANPGSNGVTSETPQQQDAISETAKKAQETDWMNPEEVLIFIREEGLTLAQKLVLLLVILLITWFFAGALSRFIRKRGEKSKRIDTTLARFFANIVRWGLLILGVIVALGTVGIEMMSFAAILAAAGLAVGLALQGSLSNFAAGVMLLLFRPFKVGDVVKVNGELGIVDQIDLFTTTMDTFDNRRLIMPNSTIFDNTIENITHHSQRRADVDVGVSYDADLQQARQVLTEVANSISTKLPDRDVQVALLAFNDSSIDWQVRVWCKKEDWFATKEELILRIKQALDQAGIGIPFPQRDVHLFQKNG